MPTVLTYGRKKPIQGEKGDTVFDALEDNIDINDSHNHDGVNSARLDPSEFIANTADVTTAGPWLASGSQYKQTVTIPATYSAAGRVVGDIGIQFYEISGATVVAQVYPTIVRVSDTTFDIYSPVNTKDYRIVYL